MSNPKFKSKIEPEVSHVENETSQMGSDLGQGDTEQQLLAQELRLKASFKDRTAVGAQASSDEKRSTMKLFGQDASTAVKSNIMPAAEEVAQNHAHKLADEECLNIIQMPDFVDHLNVFM